MSTVIKSPGADFAGGPGHHLSPFVRPADLAMGYDFSRADWKTGLVAGQAASAATMDFTTASFIADDSGWSRTLDGLGVHFDYAANRAGIADLGYAVPAIATNDGVGRTFLLLAGSEDNPSAGGTTYRPILVMGAQFALGETMYANPNGNVGARIGGAFEGNFEFGFPPRKPDLANLTVLRCNGNSTWDLFIPNMGRRGARTNAALGIASPFAAGGATLGVTNPGSTLYAHNFRVYAAAVWSRALTDPEVYAQYQRLRLRFRGVLN